MRMDLALSFETAATQLVTLTLTYNAPADASELRFVTDGDLLTLSETRLTNQAGDELVPPIEWSDLTEQDREMLTALLDGRPSRFDVASVLPTMGVLAAAQTQEAEPAVSEYSRA
jgi:hypothetical protein